MIFSPQFVLVCGAVRSAVCVCWRWRRFTAGRLAGRVALPLVPQCFGLRHHHHPWIFSYQLLQTNQLSWNRYVEVTHPEHTYLWSFQSKVKFSLLCLLWFFSYLSTLFFTYFFILLSTIKKFYLKSSTQYLMYDYCSSSSCVQKLTVYRKYLSNLILDTLQMFL